jgi:hypothetical protein
VEQPARADQAVAARVAGVPGQGKAARKSA